MFTVEEAPWDFVDPDLLDEVVLAVITYSWFQAGGAWKSLPWEVTDRLYEAGLIKNPRNTSKSIEFTGEGEERGLAALRRLLIRREA